MGKRIINLYADDESIEVAKKRGLNLSEFFRGMLNLELGFEDEEEMTKDQLIKSLKLRLGKVTLELKDANEELKELREYKKKTKEKDEGWIDV